MPVRSSTVSMAIFLPAERPFWVIRVRTEAIMQPTVTCPVNSPSRARFTPAGLDRLSSSRP